MSTIDNIELWHDFFHVYESLPELWKINSEDYKDRKKRKRAMETLLEAYLPIDPKANVDGLKHKILSIRACFRREVRKVEESERSGATGDEIYVPNLWYYEPLLFLRQERVGKHAQNKHQQQQETETEQQIDDSIDSFNEIVLEDFVDFVPSRKSSKSSSTRKRRRLSAVGHFKSADKESCEQILRQRHAECDREHGICECRRRGCVENDRGELPGCERCERRDEAAILAECWATSYRKMNEEQQLYAKKAIDDILLLGQLKKLTLQAVPLNEFL